MFSNFFLKKSKKKDFLFLIIQVHFLVLILIVVLWSISRLNQGAPSFLTLIFSPKNLQQTQIEEQNRSATIISPSKKASPSNNK